MAARRIVTRASYEGPRVRDGGGETGWSAFGSDLEVAIPEDGEGRPIYPDDMVAQFHRALDNLETVLAKAGLGLADVVRLNYYVTDVSAFLETVPLVGERLRKVGCKPASTLLGIVRLAEPEWMIEIEATAVA